MFNLDTIVGQTYKLLLLLQYIDYYVKIQLHTSK
nr:MAG TPA: hypothetical protein [Caudoviricetes sp.]